jgi:hypothetical protein
MGTEVPDAVAVFRSPIGSQFASQPKRPRAFFDS